MRPVRHGFPVLSAIPILILMSGAFGTAEAQDYPNRVIRLVTSEAGGGSDLAARILTPLLSANLGQPVVVENRGGGVIAGEVVAKAPPDGHTLLVYGNTFWLLPLMRASVSYDPVRDFQPVSLMAMTPSVLVIHPSMPVQSVSGLIALAKAKPGVLNYSSAAPGTTSQLGAELFKAMTGVNIVRLGFKGAPSAMNALLTGEAHLMFAIVAPAVANAKAGRVRALAVTSPGRTALAPGLATMAESGLPGFEVTFTPGLFAPAGTPTAIVERLHREITRLIERPEIREKYLSVGMEALGQSPEIFAAAIKREIAVIGKVVKSAGIRED
jgi:tripartite-type tricarboxylate transporter receptor subunit TctC